MADRFTESHIRQLPLFEKIPDQYISRMAEAFRAMRLEPGEYLFQQGQTTQGFYLLLSGRAQLTQVDPATDRERPLAIVQENQYLNENALFQQGTEQASLRALQTTTVLFLSRQRFMDVISHQPEIKLYLPIPVEVERAQKREQVFRGQRDNEEVLLNTRRHWWAFVRKVWRPLLIAIVMVVIGSFIPPQLEAVAYLLDFAAIFIHFPVMLYYYLEWRNDHVIITDQRVIHIEVEILTFQSRVSEVPISSIQEVNADNITTDPFSRILDYGTVELKTAGDAGNLKLTVVPNPDAIQDLIFANRTRQSEAQAAEQRQVVRATVDKVIGRQTSEQPAVQAPGSTTDAKPPLPPATFSLLKTRFIDDKGRTVYRKNIAYWLRLTLLPGVSLIIAFGLVIAMFVVPGLGRLNPIGPLFMAFLGLIFSLWFYLADWDWRHDMYIVGDETIQLIHMRPFWLQDETDQILLASVDNVISEQSGIFQTMFNYGDVKIFLVGADKASAKVFKSVSRPNIVQAEITRRQARYRQKVAEAEEIKRRNEIEEYLSVYHETVAGSQIGTIPGSNYFYPGIGQNVPIPIEHPQPAPNNREEPLEGFHLNRTVHDRVRPPKIPRIRRRD